MACSGINVTRNLDVNEVLKASNLGYAMFDKEVEDAFRAKKPSLIDSDKTTSEK